MENAKNNYSIKYISPSDLKYLSGGLLLGSSTVSIGTEFIDIDSNSFNTIDKALNNVDENYFAQSIKEDMSFEQAFICGRHEVGSGGFFVWKDNLYSTFTLEEWQALSKNEQEEFCENVIEYYNEYHVHFVIESPVLNNTPFDFNEAPISQFIVNDDENQIDEQIDSDIGVGTNSELYNDVEITPVLSDIPVLPSIENIDPIVSNSEILDSDISSTANFVIGGADMNNDGVFDAYGIDENNDGNADFIAVDTDHNGKLNEYLIDVDGDGELDLIVLDDSENGLDSSDNILEFNDIIPISDFEIINDPSIEETYINEFESTVDDILEQTIDDFSDEGL